MDVRFRLVIFLPLLCSLGCTILHVVEPSPTVISAEIAAGDRIEVLLSSGAVQEITVLRVTDEGIFGDVDAGQETLIGYDEIAGLQVRRIARGKTAGLVAGIVIILGAIQFSQGENIL